MGEKGEVVVAGLVGEVTVCVLLESEVLVVIVRGWEAADVLVVVFVVVPTEVVTVLAAGKVGGVRARKAEKKFEKKGLRFGAMVV